MRILVSADAEDDLLRIHVVLDCRQDPEKTQTRIELESS